MRLLYLIRHASPRVQPDVPAREWVLSEAGIAEAQALARTAAGWGLRALYASSEPKARGTALIISGVTALNVHVVDAFDELRISDWIGNSDEFNEHVRMILDGHEPARGGESAHEAASRFAVGIRIVEGGPFPAALVSHGRVLTAFLSEAGLIDDAFEFWRAIPMPGWACIDLDARGAGQPVTFAP